MVKLMAAAVMRAVVRIAAGKAIEGCDVKEEVHVTPGGWAAVTLMALR